MADELWEERIERKIDEIHAKVMRKRGRPATGKPKKAANEEGATDSPTPSSHIGDNTIE